jgi:ATP-binding cassette subfamily B protein IrtB
MIRGLRELLTTDQRGQLTVFLVWGGLYGVLQGLAVSMLVPIARHLHAGDLQGAWTWVGVLAVTASLSGVAHYVQAMRGFAVGLGAMRSMHRRLGDHMVTLPLGWFGGSDATVGSITQIASKGTQAVGIVPGHLLTPVVVGITTPATVVVAMLLFDWRLGVALLVAIPLVLVLGRVSSRLISRSDHAAHEAQTAVSDRVLEFARAQSTLRASGRSHDRGGYLPLRRAITAQHAVERRALIESSIGSALNGTGVQAAFTMLVIVAAVLALDGTLSGIDLLALLGVASRFTGPLTDVADFGSQLRTSAAEIARVQRILDVAPLPEPSTSAPVTTPGEIIARDVHFSYTAGDDVLDGVSFTVPARSMTALVGPSGSGKTTITRLIARFWDVDEGSVHVGGPDVREQTTADLMAQLTLVFQDVYIFDDTLRGNIRMGAPDAAEEEIDRAAELAGVDEIVRRLPHGWDTPVGEAGAALSGGEKQRVSIARALVKDAPIVLLDEATAALDPENEKHVQASLEALRERSTLLVIAHRLSTVMNADQILVLDENGHIVEHGTHDELLSHPDGRYTSFWHERTAARTWHLSHEP